MQTDTRDIPDPDPRCDICGSSQFMGSLCIPCHDDYSPHREPPGDGGEEKPEAAKEDGDE